MSGDHDARMWWADDLGGLELLGATLTEFAFRPHAHEEFFIALTERGLATPAYRGDTHVVVPGDVIVLNPEEAHAGGPPADTSWTYRALYPHPDLLRATAAEFPGDRRALPEFAGDVVRDRELASRLRRFHQLSELPATSPLEREAYLAEALVMLVGRHGAPPREPRPPGQERGAVRLAREYLATHATGQVSLAALARHAGLSPFHLCRVFRAATGMPPHAYQTQLRVRHAKQLLRTGTSIARAATDAGFYDQAHLTRHFKGIVGLTPGEYRSAIQI